MHCPFQSEAGSGSGQPELAVDVPVHHGGVEIITNGIKQSSWNDPHCSQSLSLKVPVFSSPGASHRHTFGSHSCRAIECVGVGVWLSYRLGN